MVVPGSTQVTLALVPHASGAVLGGTTTVLSVAGVATFSNLSVNRLGSGFVLRASAPTLVDATSAPFDIGASNVIPVALVSPAEQTIDPGAQAVLDASGSHALSGTSLTAYHWALTEGPGGLVLEGAAALGVSPLEPGTYIFRLVVEDGAGLLSTPVTARVIVRGEPFRPASTLGGCQCGALGEPSGALFLLGLLLALRALRSGGVSGSRPRSRPRRVACG
jgi:hypothetical protein